MSRRELIRAVVIATLALPPLVYLALYAYIVAWTGMTVGQALPRMPLCWLVALVVLNLVLRGPLRGLRLSGGELRLIYALTGIGLATCGVGYAMSITPTLGGGLSYYGGVVTPDWLQHLPHLPEWAMVRDEEVVRGLYLGHDTLYRADHLRALAVPVLAWVSLLSLFLAGQLCLSELLRKQWIRRERLTFPLVFLPLELSQTDGSFWRSRWMWLGFAVAALLNLNNGLSHLYPAVPEIRIKLTRLPTPVTPPWTGLGGMVIAWYPFVIGIGFLLATDVSLSLWLFHFIAKLQMVLAVAFGFRADGGFPSPTAPYLPSQGAGAFIMLGLVALWRVRRPLLEALRRRDGEVPGWAAHGLWLSVAGILWFGRAAGVPLNLMLIWVILHGVMAVAVARLVAEAGAPLAMTPVYPQQVMYETFGDSFGPLDWTRFTLFRNVDELYTDVLPVHALSGYRLLDGQLSGRRIAPLFAAMALFGLLAGIWALCDIYFRHGIMNVKATWPDRTQAQLPWQQLESWLRGGMPRDGRTVGLCAGGLVMGALIALRQRLLWWPVHPIGYAVAGSYAIQQLWLPFLIAWALKTLVLRTGGLKLYRRCLPAALGLILGDILVPQFWTIIGVILDQPMYFSFPS